MSEFIRLYRQILRIHRLLPAELRILGDNYIKNEFRLHKKVDRPEVFETFYKEWHEYQDKLVKQLANEYYIENPDSNERASKKEGPLGSKLEMKRLSEFNDDQLYTLMELRKHTQFDNSK